MIKIITLLEIIAKGTGKIPTKIKWLGNIYLYNGFDYVYRYEDEEFDGSYIIASKIRWRAFD